MSRLFLKKKSLYVQKYRGSLCDVVANVLDCAIKVSEFELQSFYNVQFWTTTLWKGMNPFIHPAMV